jgi:threonine dehydrogenase-like Zn-dependent dehydrogenase
MRVPTATLVPLDKTQRRRVDDRRVRTGAVGLSATLLVTARGARVIAIDPEPARLAQAQKLGAIATIDPTAVQATAALRDLTGGAGVHLILETSGATQAAADGLASLAPWGRMCIVGLSIRWSNAERALDLDTETLGARW